MMERFIVAEVSKTWTKDSEDNAPICHKFESVINTNFKRGYRLLDWKLNSTLLANGGLTETIVAVFELIEAPARATVPRTDPMGPPNQ